MHNSNETGSKSFSSINYLALSWEDGNMGYEEDRRARALAIYAEMGWGENEGVKEAD